VQDAACLGVDPELWFVVDPDSFERSQALRICGTCEVKTQCLKVARKRRERFGVWGGVDFNK
jgi:WhiB family redox-sensing transcriptional regulator